MRTLAVLTPCLLVNSQQVGYGSKLKTWQKHMLERTLGLPTILKYYNHPSIELGSPSLTHTIHYNPISTNRTPASTWGPHAHPRQVNVRDGDRPILVFFLKHSDSNVFAKLRLRVNPEVNKHPLWVTGSNPMTAEKSPRPTRNPRKKSWKNPNHPKGISQWSKISHPKFRFGWNMGVS